MQNQIKELRSHVGLNQTDFGARIGVRQSTIAGWETGQRIPPDSAIVSICREFHVDEHWLRTGNGKMFTATTRDEEIMDFVGRATIGAGDDFKRRFLLALARLPEERWADIEDFARQITAENAKEEQDRFPAPLSLLFCFSLRCAQQCQRQPQLLFACFIQQPLDFSP